MATPSQTALHIVTHNFGSWILKDINGVPLKFAKPPRHIASAIESVQTVSRGLILKWRSQFENWNWTVHDLLETKASEESHKDAKNNYSMKIRWNKPNSAQKWKWWKFYLNKNDHDTITTGELPKTETLPTWLGGSNGVLQNAWIP